MSEKIELKPCPFCGTVPTYDEGDTVGSSVTCRGCGTDGPWKTGQESHKAIEAWNRRAPVADGVDLYWCDCCEELTENKSHRCEQWAHLDHIPAKAQKALFARQGAFHE